MNLEHLAQAQLTCPRCGAQRGRHCVTKSGLRSPRPHSIRTAPLYDAWRDGYGRGRADMAHSALSAAKSKDGSWAPFVVRAERAIAAMDEATR